MGHKELKGVKKQVAANTITSDDGDHVVKGTEHFNDKDPKDTKAYKKHYASIVSSNIAKFLRVQKSKGKEVDFGVEGGSHESPEKGYEKDIALKTTDGGKRKGVHLKSNELGDWSKYKPKGYDKPLMRDDADRTEKEFKRAFPRDYGDPENPESKKIDQINRIRQKGFNYFAKKARTVGRGSVQLIGSGHMKPDTAAGHSGTPGVKSKRFGEQIRKAVLTYLNEIRQRDIS